MTRLRNIYNQYYTRSLQLEKLDASQKWNLNGWNEAYESE